MSLTRKTTIVENNLTNSINGDFVNLSKTQTITGVKTFTSGLSDGAGTVISNGVVTTNTVINVNSDLRVTTRDGSTLYLNDDKVGGDCRINTGSSSSNTFIENGSLNIQNGGLTVNNGFTVQGGTVTFPNSSISSSAIYGSINGVIGYTGFTGYTGYTGQQGIAGYAANTGATGDIGPTGYTGQQGIAGYAANTGATGPTGYTGQQGIGGLAANTGSTGATGSIGLVGAKGLGMTYVGVWSQFTTYKINDIAFYNNQSYICKLSNQQIAPDNPDPQWWGLIAKQGAQGNQGNQGNVGSKGDTGATGNTGSKGDTGDSSLGSILSGLLNGILSLSLAGAAYTTLSAWMTAVSLAMDGLQTQIFVLIAKTQNMSSIPNVSAFFGGIRVKEATGYQTVTTYISDGNIITTSSIEINPLSTGSVFLADATGNLTISESLNCQAVSTGVLISSGNVNGQNSNIIETVTAGNIVSNNDVKSETIHCNTILSNNIIHSIIIGEAGGTVTLHGQVIYGNDCDIGDFGQLYIEDGSAAEEGQLYIENGESTTFMNPMNGQNYSL